MILFDTQVLVWSSFGDKRLGIAGREQVANAVMNGDVLMSPISAWEIAMLVAKGRLQLNIPVQDWVGKAAQNHGVTWAGLSAQTAAAAGILSRNIHGDPADRLIIATALALACPLLTSDSKILAYAKAGHVQAIDARR